MRLTLHIPRLVWKLIWRTFAAVWIIVGIAFLLMRYVAAPQVAEHREDIAAALTRAIGTKVEIDSLHAQWTGLRPELLMRGVRVFDKQGREALKLPGVDLAIAWSSLLRWQPELHRLRIDRPELAMRREADGRIFIAGIPLDRDGPDEGSHVFDVLLSQHEVRIDDARISWDDRLRAAPPLSFEKFSLLWRNAGNAHRFAVLATPAQQLAGPLDIRGDLRSKSGSDVRKLANWRGTLYTSLERADLAVWNKWIDYPIRLPQGRGALRAWLNFEGQRLGGLTADLALANVQARFADELPMLDLKSLSGRLRVAARENDLSIAAERLALTTQEGLQIGPTQFSMRRIGVPEGATGAAATRRPTTEFQAARLDMRVLSRLAAYLPFPPAWRQRLVATQPEGIVSSIKAKWEDPGAVKATDSAGPLRFDLDANFDKLSLQAGEDTPGFSNLSGRLRGNERKGEFQLDVRNGGLEVPGILHEPHVALDQAEVAGQWQRAGKDKDGLLSVKVDKLVLSNADIHHAEFSADWHEGPGRAGTIEMNGRVQRFKAGVAWRFIPTVVPVETSEWLKRGLTSGNGENLRVRLSGDLAHFPFRDYPKGVFRVEGKFVGVNLDFADGWPVLDNLGGELLFDRTRMLIRSHGGNYRQARLGEVQAELADLENVSQSPLVIKGSAAGPGGDMLHYLQASPVATHLGSFIEQMRQEGDGALELKLAVPLLDAANTRVEGNYRFNDGRLLLTPALPAFQQVRGVLGFNERGIGPTQVSAQFLGGLVNATGRTLADGTIQFDATGQVPASGLSQLVDTPIWSKIGGQTEAVARITVGKGRADVVVTSNLLGITSSLPRPLGKAADARVPFSFAWGLGDDPNLRNTSVQDWRLSLESHGAAQWQDRCSKDQCSFLRGAVALNDTPSMPSRGLRVSGRFKSLDLDQWRPILLGAAAREADDKGILSGAVLQADEVLAGGHRFARVTARAVQQGERWVLRLEGPDIAGDVTWAGESSRAASRDANGRLSAHLSQLVLHPITQEAGATSVANAPSPDEKQEQLPALDITAERFQLRDMQLGKLSLHAATQGGLWRLSELRIESPDAVITGDGSSRSAGSGKSQTDIALDIDSDNLGGFLGRIGYPEAVRRGRAKVKGKLTWNGPPTSIDYPSLSGELDLDVADGQFNKLEPGAARLLGILSLQSLPRRITLDFRDVFSDGFAFDSIRGDFRIGQGVMHTDNLEIRGPAARVFMKGSTDIAHETHDLRLTVQPSLSDGIALGVTVLNPVVGVATYLAQKVLRDPFEKMFSFDYTVTGSWADPKIEKESASAAASAPLKSE